MARPQPARGTKAGLSSGAGRASWWQGSVHTWYSSRARLQLVLVGERTNGLLSSVSSEPGNGVCVHASIMAGELDWTDVIRMKRGALVMNVCFVRFARVRV